MTTHGNLQTHTSLRKKRAHVNKDMAYITVLYSFKGHIKLGQSPPYKAAIVGNVYTNR